MGGVIWSQTATQPEPSVETPNDIVAVKDDEANDEQRKKKRDEEMQKFKDEMTKKREARKEAIQNLNKRIAELQEERDIERKEKAQLKEEVNQLLNGSEVRELRHQLEVLQRAKDDGAKVEEKEEETNLETPREDVFREDSDKDEVIEGLERQVRALKDVATIGGEMLRIRELQVNELKSKLEAIEETGVAYEKEVENMKKLRNLYEERARAMTISHQMELEREKSKTLAAETRQKIAEHKTLEMEEKNKEIEERTGKIEGELDNAKMQISELKIKLASKSEDLYSATSQLAVVNHLFSQLFSPGQDSLEKITKVLEEHHDLVNHLTANGKINDLASTLVEIADKDPLPTREGDNDMSGHLSKVWRLLVELLGHHIVKPTPEEASPESCYKSVDTPSGPKLVISVSQTFLRLKDLILEKNSLMKEVGRLKDLNSTLESRLMEQESRLSIVTTELHSTWGVVNKLKRQHQNLHTNEQVLRYELAQKRLLLTDLKKQLEECKENWSLARAKNNQTERDWKLLRSEFALRKQQASSAESGYEESPTDSQDEEEWKEEKNKSVSSDEEHDVLGWNDSEESRTGRRGTLTELTQPQQRVILDLSVDDANGCTVLPWTDPEESSGDNSLAEDSRVGTTVDAGCSEFSGDNLAEDMERAEIDGGSLETLNCSSHDNWDNSNGIRERFGDSRMMESAQERPGTSTSFSLEKTSESSHQPGHSTLSPEAVSRLAGPSEALPSTSSTSQPRPRTAEEILQARQDRLQRLEEGCKGLFSKMTRTNQRSEIIKTRLTELHEIYGEDSRNRRESSNVDVAGPSSIPSASSTLSTVEPSPEPTTNPPTPPDEPTTNPSTLPDEPTTNPPTPPPFPSIPLYLTKSPQNSDDSNR